MKAVRSLGSQSLHRVDARSAARRQIASCGCNGYQQNASARKRKRIERTDAENDALHEARKRERAREAHRNSEQRQTDALPQHEARNIFWLGAKSDADSNLTGSQAHRIAQHAIKANGSEHECNDAEVEQHRHVESP